MDIIMSIKHFSGTFVVTKDGGWFRLAKFGCLEEIPPMKDPYGR